MQSSDIFDDYTRLNEELMRLDQESKVEVRIKPADVRALAQAVLLRAKLRKVSSDEWRETYRETYRRSGGQYPELFDDGPDYLAITRDIAGGSDAQAL